MANLMKMVAPEKGEKARKNLSKKGEDLANALNETIDAKFEELLGMVTGKTKKSNANNEHVNATPS